MSARLEGFDHRHSQKLDFALNAVLSGPMSSVSNMESAFSAPGRHFTDRTVQIDIGDQPTLAVAPHHVIDFDWLAVGFDDLALRHDARWCGLLASHLELLAGIAVEAVGINRRDVAPEGFL